MAISRSCRRGHAKADIPSSKISSIATGCRVRQLKVRWIDNASHVRMLAEALRDLPSLAP